MNTQMNESQTRDANGGVINAETVNAGYEAPHVEEVLTPETLEREVAYAGTSRPSVLPS